MLRLVLGCAMAATLALPAQAQTITAKQRMETCKFGADDQKLAGAARNAFLKKCMAKGDPPGTHPKPSAKPAAKPAG